MSCRHCGLGPHEHDGRRRIYMTGKGWLKPCSEGYEAADAPRGVVIPWKAAVRTMLKETFAFAEKKRLPRER
jgi:hypothetical protein